MPGERKDEAALHRLFKSHRIAGEWFSPHPEVLKVLHDAVRLSTARPHGKAAPLGKGPFVFYLAGKITGRNAGWRDTLLGPDRDAPGFSPEDTPATMVDAFRFDLWPVRDLAFPGGGHQCCGPYRAVLDDGWGHGGDYNWVTSNEEDSHTGFPDNWHDHALVGDHCNGEQPILKRHRSQIIELCRTAIDRCDILFAWLDGLDAYATLTEIGYAKAIGKTVWVASPGKLRDLWFIHCMADRSSQWLATPAEALACMLCQHSEGEARVAT
jgi:hypothetical protein